MTTEIGVKFYDRTKLSESKIDEYGIFRAKAAIAREGVQEYRTVDGKLVRILRMPDSVAESAPTFKLKPITLDHPEEFVTADNSSVYTRGFTGDVVMDNGMLITDIAIADKDAINAVTDGSHKYFSCGYTTDLLVQEGTWVDSNGVQGKKGKSYKYDAIQQNIRGNHVALVTEARAGKKATIIDGAESGIIQNIYELVDADEPIDSSPDSSMYYLLDKNSRTTPMQIIFDDSIFNIDGDDAGKVKDIIATIKSKLADSISAITKLTNEKLALEGECEGLKIKLADTQASAINDMEARINSEVASRLEVIDAVKNHIPVTQLAGLSAIEMKRAYLLTKAPHLDSKIKDADASFIEGLWSGLKPTKADDSLKAQLSSVSDSATPDDSFDYTDLNAAINAAQDAAIKEYDSRWKTR